MCVRGESGLTTFHVLHMFCLFQIFLKLNNLFLCKIKTSVKTDFFLLLHLQTRHRFVICFSADFSLLLQVKALLSWIYGH